MTSAVADMIEREFHSCQVILFPNLFFIIPEKQLVLSGPRPRMEVACAEFPACASLQDARGDCRKSCEPAVLTGWLESNSQA